jgi:S-methylmethionine-dependent homocysteine/selenocysteine methylase
MTFEQRSARLPHLSGRAMVTDGGLETDLIFNRGVDLREFAAFPLVDDGPGREVLAAYYDGYAAIAAKAGAGLLLESATWRANADWGTRLGYDPEALRRVNAGAIELLGRLRDRYAQDVADIVVSGQVGPRAAGDATNGGVDPDDAAQYHLPQVQAFADAGADQVTALTLATTGEAVGVTRAARRVGLPVAISFTVGVDGRLPDGTPLHQAVVDVDAAAAPDYFMVNCAHPRHVAPATSATGSWRERLLGMRYNASTMSHAELDEATELDRGDLDLLVDGHLAVRRDVPALVVLGGCCGTDAAHVARLWGVGEA